MMITLNTYFYITSRSSSHRQYTTSPPTTFVNTFCLYNNQLQLLFSPDHVIFLLGNLPGDKVLQSPCPSLCATFVQPHLSNIQRLPNSSYEYFCLLNRQQPTTNAIVTTGIRFDPEFYFLSTLATSLMTLSFTLFTYLSLTY